MPASGVVTREHALRSLAGHVLGTPRDLDAAGLLDWSRDPRGSLELRDLDSQARDALLPWLRERTGVGCGPIIDLALRGDGTDGVPLGLVAGVAWRAASVGRSRGHVESRLGVRSLSDSEALRWAALCEAWVLRKHATDPPAASVVLDRADELAHEVGIDDAVATSPHLRAGLRARLQAVAAALPAAAERPGAPTTATLERAWGAVEGHHLAESEATAGAVRMAVRLVRWLAQHESPPATVEGCLRWQVATGGWVDRARQVVANGVDDAFVGAGLTAVHVAASDARSAVDRRAADLVGDAVARDQPVGAVVPVEDALRVLVQPLALEAPVLLLVLDGMSAAVASEVLESAVAAGWGEHLRSSDAGRDVVMAGLPTVTDVSRTSLLSGRRQSGRQRQEREGIRDVLGDRTSLFHLRDLQSPAGRDLPDEVRDAVQATDAPVVGAVLNAVDDSLSGGDPARTRWTLDAVSHLVPLLERARAAGRVVVLTSDHGHVVDQGVEGEVRYQQSGAGARWREGADDVQDDEVRLRGARVLKNLTGGGGDVVAAVGETLRYKQRSEGYHGGAALAELAIPFAVLSWRGRPVPGWTAAGDQAPGWWSRPAALPIEEGEGETLFS